MNDKKDVGVGVLLLTDRRLVFYRKSVIGTVTREEYPINKISSVSLRKGVIFGSIHIYTGSIESVIKDCKNDRAQKMVDELQALMHKTEVTSSAPVIIHQAAAVDVSGELQKWHDLKEKGIISQAEFDAKKSQLLA
jgi:hypothetical protein